MYDFQIKAAANQSIDDDNQIDRFSVNRPCDGIFYDVLVEIMKEVPTLLTWGSGYCKAMKPSQASRSFCSRRLKHRLWCATEKSFRSAFSRMRRRSNAIYEMMIQQK